MEHKASMVLIIVTAIGGFCLSIYLGLHHMVQPYVMLGYSLICVFAFFYAATELFYVSGIDNDIS